MQSRRAGAPIKYQARIACKADGEKKAKQRGLGTFDSVFEAAAVVEAAEAKLKAGIWPWDEPQRVNKHARGEVRLSHIIPQHAPMLAVGANRCSMLQAPPLKPLPQRSR